MTLLGGSSGTRITEMHPGRPERATLSVPAVPPSLNQIGYRSHWAVGRKAKQEWELWLLTVLLEQRVPKGLASVKASATIRFTQRRRRDEGNFRALLEKALGDVLQRGWIEDDTTEHYRFGRVELLAPCERPETIVVLDYER
jgi:hypothetical protein